MRDASENAAADRLVKYFIEYKELRRRADGNVSDDEIAESETEEAENTEMESEDPENEEEETPHHIIVTRQVSKIFV